MGSCICHSLHILLAILVLLTLATYSVSSSSPAQLLKAIFTDDYHAANRSKVLAVFVFGDSTVDPGNNNFLSTIFKSNFPPYGRDFAGSQPTGRFTDGRLVTDFIASYAGIKEYIPPYLDPSLTLEQLKTGVSFASAGSGFDPLTAKLSSVLPISKQLEYFREYRSKMERLIGKREMDHIINRSIFAISAGTNDFGINYFLLPVRRKSYTVSEYQQYLVGHLQQLIKVISHYALQLAY
ncbi:unnamed protein product [Rhodiola kirilowii]